MVQQRESIRVANCSGYYGDRISAAREMVDGGPIDFLTGDYLAELTMMILWKTRQRGRNGGYARTFLTQMEEVLGTCLERGIKIVTNAGGLNPSGLAQDLEELAAALGLHPHIAYIDGDDVVGRLPEWTAQGYELLHLDTGQPLREREGNPVTANAYLGAWGVVEALRAGANVVVCPRVTDASVVVGPAAWAFDWKRDDWDSLAGAVAAGHVIECGTQATGGNYSFFQEIESPVRPGFPIAEIRADGSSVVTKHPGTPGQVSIGTVTAQLLYEIDNPRYLNPDVTAHFDTVHVEQEGQDRVLMHEQKGSPPPEQLKVCINFQGGFKNTYSCMITGLDIEAKAKFATESVIAAVGGLDRFRASDVQLLRRDRLDARTNVEATAQLTITVIDDDPELVGKQFAAAVNGIGLALYPGNYNDVVSPKPTEFGVLWPTLIPAELVTQRVVLPDNEIIEIPGPPTTSATPRSDTTTALPLARVPEQSETVSAPLGNVVGARSGDKGGNANLGVWARTDDVFEWLRRYLTIERLRDLLPEVRSLDIHRYELANLRALNFVIVGILGEGVAASTRPDPQAKSLGEFLRSRLAPIPRVLLGERTAEATEESQCTST